MAEKKGFAEYVQRGNNIDFTAADGAEYMQVVPMPDRIGIAMENIQPGGTGTVTLVGVFRLPAATGTELQAGEKVYWDSTNGNITKTAESNVPAGYAIAPKPSAIATAVVRIG